MNPPTALEALRACRAACDRILDQYDGVTAGVDWPALSKTINAALTQPAESAEAGAVPADSVWLFKGPDGRWMHFMDERHQRLTIESGAWEVRQFVALAEKREGAKP